jgi:hypothetical protein
VVVEGGLSRESDIRAAFTLPEILIEDMAPEICWDSEGLAAVWVFEAMSRRVVSLQSFSASQERSFASIAFQDSPMYNCHVIRETVGIFKSSITSIAPRHVGSAVVFQERSWTFAWLIACRAQQSLSGAIVTRK